ncbi:GNAT family N-acetyltransferase [Bacteroides thetaiotaomicron]|uniref:GNAT family N-acetyltransferase n=1 Tax=Bacteroides thetaiotaomicron TaxID=818 RepID=UPI0023311485|nr:GNAT family N-acetyltransferase [Bacteroides thetaiotaomicron]MDC2009068.1 GNAT family N-acetyltransferase [Bacteroides thetaiotaomicron]MDC2023214.1 GNAT family N-acetyltransferase [Bacteroides thetaiotaomicron]MDC2025812.1 GNAT family N-acetyltransferase [Bacteroides thetaiotaomicron]MDC2032322.1 GNAT family N-acetyltransferase [Bacteroides thetaiotaomicron]MDC2063285.1 GNAT family N-acetyltransferase [Bacteroides thetaiotaomicron]
MKTVPELTTSRCALRQIAIEDLPLLSQIMQDEQSQQYLPELYDIVKTEKGLLQCVSSFETYLHQDEGILWGIYANEDFIGYIALMDISVAPSVFYALHPLHRKHGYMKECLKEVISFLFNNSLCNYLQTEVYENNAASLNILNANGFNVVKYENGKFYLQKVAIPDNVMSSMR